MDGVRCGGIRGIYLQIKGARARSGLRTMKMVMTKRCWIVTPPCVTMIQDFVHNKSVRYIHACECECLCKYIYTDIAYAYRTYIYMVYSAVDDELVSAQEKYGMRLVEKIYGKMCIYEYIYIWTSMYTYMYIGTYNLKNIKQQPTHAVLSKRFVFI